MPAVKTLTGGCLCGAVRFTAAPQKHEFAACHCGMCRRWSSGPFFAVHCGDTVKIENDADLGIYRSSKWAERGFCKRCGTSLFYRLVGRDDFWEMSAEAFDDRSNFEFKTEIFIDEKPPAYDFANPTKKMTRAEVFADFDPSQANG